jgi:hypothetical protein
MAYALGANHLNATGDLWVMEYNSIPGFLAFHLRHPFNELTGQYCFHQPTKEHPQRNHRDH